VQINYNFSLQFVTTQNSLSHAKIAQSCVLASGYCKPRLYEILDFTYSISELHTFPFRLHIKLN